MGNRKQITVALLFLGLLTISNVQCKERKSSKARRFFKGFLPGAAGGGLVAGLAGGAKWTPVGILGGGAIGSAISMSRDKHRDDE